MKLVLLPYLVYWCACVFYFSIHILNPMEDGQFFNVFSAEFFWRVIIFIGIIYFFSLEVIQAYRKRLVYFMEIYNFFDVFSLLFNFV